MHGRNFAQVQQAHRKHSSSVVASRSFCQASSASLRSLSWRDTRPPVTMPTCAIRGGCVGVSKGQMSGGRVG